MQQIVKTISVHEEYGLAVLAHKYIADRFQFSFHKAPAMVWLACGAMPPAPKKCVFDSRMPKEGESKAFQFRFGEHPRK